MWTSKEGIRWQWQRIAWHRCLDQKRPSRGVAWRRRPCPSRHRPWPARALPSSAWSRSRGCSATRSPTALLPPACLQFIHYLYRSYLTKWVNSLTKICQFVKNFEYFIKAYYRATNLLFARFVYFGSVIFPKKSSSLLKEVAVSNGSIRKMASCCQVMRIQNLCERIHFVRNQQHSN